MVRKQKPIILETIWQGGAILLVAAAIGLMVNQMRPDPLPLVGVWSPEARVKLELGESIVISLEGSLEFFFNKKPVFVDARSPELYERGHIEGALNLPWDDFEKLFREVLKGISNDAVLVTYCDGEGCGQSHELALALFKEGYKNVRVLVGGLRLWQEAQLPVAKGTFTQSLGK
ncbi:MAG TPA: rhodanese-like domain-containing protein [Acidobacteriota bacterium]|nr:rhodanese-like domain-containing protein [Acidobacteriota bacterium]